MPSLSEKVGNSADKLRHPRSGAEQVLLNKQQIWVACLVCSCYHEESQPQWSHSQPVTSWTLSTAVKEQQSKVFSLFWEKIKRIFKAQCSGQIGDLTTRHWKIDRVRSAPPEHRFDMKMLLLLTQICKCSFLLDLSNQSGRTAWLKYPV